jgi:hypothetical protein
MHSRTYIKEKTTFLFYYRTNKGGRSKVMIPILLVNNNHIDRPNNISYEMCANNQFPSCAIIINETRRQFLPV